MISVCLGVRGDVVCCSVHGAVRAYPWSGISKLLFVRCFTTVKVPLPFLADLLNFGHGHLVGPGLASTLPAL